MKHSMIALIIILGVAVAACSLQADTQKAKSAKRTIWMAPPSAFDGKCFRDLFTSPDAWKNTRSNVDVLFYADHMLNKQFKDEELRKWFGMMHNWNLKFGLEVGAVKEWGTTGQATFDIERKMWDRFTTLGANISAIALDEPLICVRNNLKKPDEYAVEETANFIALVRKNYPNMKIGDIEPYPSLTSAELLWWVDALQKRLAEKNVRGLDFFRIDPDWVNFVMASKGSWPDLKQVELGCRQRGIPFSLIYWAADYPQMERMGLADDSTWYVAIMQQGYDYAIAGGDPDECVIESWVSGPAKTVPDMSGFTFTRSVLDFSKRFAQRK